MGRVRVRAPKGGLTSEAAGAAPSTRSVSGRRALPTAWQSPAWHPAALRGGRGKGGATGPASRGSPLDGASGLGCGRHSDVLDW